VVQEERRGAGAAGDCVISSLLFDLDLTFVVEHARARLFEMCFVSCQDLCQALLLLVALVQHP
jgi:hypothetical protein